MAAAARSPGISDGRVPCPRCGGLIHPVAGRCKHCKEDLSALRAGRPAAAAPLPALNGRGNGHANGHVQLVAPSASAPMPVPVPVHAPTPVMPVMNEGSQPILPPRPTGRSFAAAEKPRSLWKSWPMLVIVLASVAIVVAVVLMVWPPSSGHETKRALQPPPAPERMETNPLPPPGAGNSNGADPWGGHSQADPPKAPQAAPDPAPAPRQTPDPLPPPDPQQDPDDLFGQLGPMPQLPNLFDPNADPMTQLAPLLKQLPNIDLDDADAQTVADLCSTYKALAKTKPACAQAQQCVSEIDKMCGQGKSISPLALMQGARSCTSAMVDC